MARLPAATWNPAGATPGGSMDPRVVIFHVTAGEGNATPHSGLEWHFEVSYSGAIEQGVDTNRQAAANYKANPFAISIETEGLGDGSWTPAQLDSLVAISEWCMAQHPKIKRQRCPTWDGSGFGYHIMFGSPGMWTPVAKSCPGPRRIRQFNEVLLPRILNQSEETVDMTPEQAATLDKIAWTLSQVKPNTDRIPAIQGAADESRYRLSQMHPALAELAGRPVVEIDAAAIAAAIPDDLAQQVADVLAGRLRD